MWWGRGWPPLGTSCKCCSSPATYTRECPAFLLVLKLGYPGLCLRGSTEPSGSPSCYTLKLLWLLLLIILWPHWQMLVLPVSLLLLLVITVNSSCIFPRQALNLNLTWTFLFVCLIFRKLNWIGFGITPIYRWGRSGLIKRENLYNIKAS